MANESLVNLGYAKDVLNSVSLFEYGTVILWIIFSFAGGHFFSQNKNDKIVGSIVLLGVGAVLFFADTSNKVILGIALIMTIILGMFKILREKKN